MRSPRSSDRARPLSAAAAAVLCVLGAGERHGYAIMQEINHASGGRSRIGPGTLYRTIQSLLDLGLISETRRDGRQVGVPRRRCYRLTPAGRKVMAEEARRMHRLVTLAMIEGGALASRE